MKSRHRTIRVAPGARNGHLHAVIHFAVFVWAKLTIRLPYCHAIHCVIGVMIILLIHIDTDIDTIRP
jgi:hypothetical protein